MQNAGVLRNTIILQQKLFCDGPLPITIAYFVDTAIVALEVVEVVPETAKREPLTLFLAGSAGTRNWRGGRFGPPPPSDLKNYTSQRQTANGV